MVSYKFPEAFFGNKNKVSGILKVFQDIKAYSTCISSFWEDYNKAFCAVIYEHDVF